MLDTGTARAPKTLSTEARTFLEAVRTVSPLALQGITVSPRTLREVESAHVTQITLHLEKDVKSMRVLRAMGR